MDKVVSGQDLRIKAADWNDIGAAVAANKKRLFDGGATQNNAGHEIIKVANNTGAPRTIFSPMLMGNPTVDPAVDVNEFMFRPTIYVDVANGGDDLNMCILQEPIGTGKVGRAMLVGVSPVSIDVTDANHLFAKPVDGEYYLESSEAGMFRIVYKQSGTGTKWALVQFPCVPIKHKYDATSGTYYADGAFPAADPP